MKFTFDNLDEFMDFYTNNKSNKSIFKTTTDPEISQLLENGNIYSIGYIKSHISNKLQDIDEEGDLDEYIFFICDLLKNKYINSIKEFSLKNNIEYKRDNFRYKLIIKELINYINYLYKKYINPPSMKNIFENGYNYKDFFDKLRNHFEEAYDININEICEDYFDLFTELWNKTKKEAELIKKEFINNNDINDEYYNFIILYIDKYIKYIS